MNASRLAAWIFGLGVGTAWLASAAGVGRRPPVPRPVPPAAIDAELATLAADVETQASRLRDRLAQAPAPSPRPRNLFAFGDRPRPELQRSPASSAQPPPAVVTEPVVSEPVLTLIGIAEMAGPSGPVRTALITGASNELLMVKAGESVIGRYEVTAIGIDAVQLKETATGAVRTLVLR